MANKPYDNFVLANEIEDQFNSHLDLDQFCTIDRDLETNEGMKKKVHVYKATNGTEKVKQGQGNTKDIEVSYDEVEYDILCAQNRFPWFDEEAMKDHLIVYTGTQHTGTDLYNTTNDDLYAEFKKATLKTTPAAFNFDAFVDAVALLDREAFDEGKEIFALVCNTDLAGIKKALKDDLKYVEAFARTGYVGTVAGVNLYVKKDATKGTIVVATKDAVTKFVKTGVQIEEERDANIRKNILYSRKYYVTALTDKRFAILMTKTAASV